MKRVSALLAVLAIGTAVSLRADVKTTEKSTTNLGGIFATMSRFMPGGGTSEVTTSLALKGDRRLATNDTTGEIADLVEQKVYRLDMKKKEYKVLTFDQIRK